MFLNLLVLAVISADLFRQAIFGVWIYVVEPSFEGSSVILPVLSVDFKIIENDEFGVPTIFYTFMIQGIFLKMLIS